MSIYFGILRNWWVSHDSVLLNPYFLMKWPGIIVYYRIVQIYTYKLEVNSRGRRKTCAGNTVEEFSLYYAVIHCFLMRNYFQNLGGAGK